MKHRISLAVMALALLSSTIGAFAAKDSKKADPVVMTVNGKDVPLSEFKYLYTKNNSQQTQTTPVDEYVDMFVTYMLKVADAEANGVDTTATFRSEFNRYRDELAAPYLKDQAVEDSLVREIYDHMATNRYVNYIMMFGGRSPQERTANRALIDSIRAEIVAGRADFGEMADRYSVDKNHGVMGYMKVNQYPYAFEQAVYNTPIGQVSQVQELAPFGYFIVRIDSERPDPGQVHARHILKMTQGLNDSLKMVKKAEIDSIYGLLVDGADFSTLAKRESDDPGSARVGGELPWFGVGEMVPEFSDAAFALADKEMSTPVETAYGYHIILRTGSRPMVPYSDVEAKIRANVNRDSRASMATDAAIGRYLKLYKGKVDEKTLKSINKEITKAGGLDSTLYVSMLSNNKKIASVAGIDITVADVTAKMPMVSGTIDADQAIKAFDHATRSLLKETTRDYATEHLGDTNPEYGNLIKEYRNGMLLFEVSNANVWERSTTDVDGLEAFFNANRDKYVWDKPHYKGYVVFCDADTVMGVVKDMMESSTASPEETVKEAKARFGKHVKIERVLAAQGDNQIIDHLVFDGPEPTKANKTWPVNFAFGGHMADQPEEAADVKGLVTADYQQKLEKEWIDSLRQKYPVKIYPEVLEKLK